MLTSNWEEWMYVIITLVLAIISVTTIFGVLWLTAHGFTAPESVIALGSTATGALAGVLVPRPSKQAPSSG